MKRKRPEQEIQKAVFAHLRTRAYPGVFAFHCPNGGYRSPVEAMVLKGLGVTPGVPDIIAIHEGKVFALELKAPGGRLSEKQKETLERMRVAGAQVMCAEGLDEALIAFEHWGLLRGTAVATA